MPSDRTPAATEPAPGADAESAGSVVVGVDPSTSDGVAIVSVNPERVEALRQRLQEAGEGFQRMRGSLAAASSAFRQYDPRYAPPVRDAMRWSPPADGEEIPPCPA